MVVSLVFGILIINVVFADDLANGITQSKDKAQNFTLRSTGGPSLTPVHNDYRYQSNEIMKSRFNNVVQSHNEGQEKCPNYNRLLTIIDKLLSIINEDPSKADTVAQFKEVLKIYSKYPLNVEHRVNPQTKPKNEDDQSDTVKILTDNNVLRISNHNSILEGGFKTQIMFKYELPNINLPNCKETFLNLMQTAYEKYEQIAKYPMCRKTPNIFSDLYENEPFSPYTHIPSPVDNKQPIMLTPKEKDPLENHNNLNQPKKKPILNEDINSHNTPAVQTPYNPLKYNKKDLLIKIVQLIPDVNIRSMYINIIKNMGLDDMQKIPDNFIQNILLKDYPRYNDLNPADLIKGNQPLNPENVDLSKDFVGNKLPNNDPWSNQINKMLYFLHNTNYPDILHNNGNTPSIYDLLNPRDVGHDINTLINKDPIINKLLPTYGNKPISPEIISLLLKIPYLKEHILKLYGILPNSNIDLSNIEQVNLLLFNKIIKNGGKIPTLLDILQSRNPYNSQPNNGGNIELTFIVRKPQPDYFVKYQLPYSEYVTNVQNLLIYKPHLRSDPLKLYQEIINLSNVSDMSPDLKSYTREDIIKLTFMNGELVETKLVNTDDNLKYNIMEVQNLNNNMEDDEILKLNKYNEMKYYNTYGLYNNMAVDKTIPETVELRTSYPPLNYFNQQQLYHNLNRPMTMANGGLYAVNPTIKSGIRYQVGIPILKNYSKK